MNIVIAGDGEVGLHLAKELANENHDITIVDPHEELLKMVESHTDLMTITGDSTSIDILKSANIKKADLLISVVHDEQINIITAIWAKSWAQQNHCPGQQPRKPEPGKPSNLS